MDSDSREQHTAVRRNIWIDLLLYPTHTLPTAAAPVLVGAGLAVHDGVFAAGPVAAAFVASWLVHVGGVFTDNYRLLVDHASVPEHPELHDALDDGTLQLAHLRWAIVACFALAALTAPYLVSVAGPGVLVFGLIGGVTSLGYAAGPFSLTRLGIADPVFLIMFGVVAEAGTYYVQAHAFTPAAFVLGLPVGAIVTAVLLIDDIRDREFDARKGWNTGPVRFGLGWTRAEFTGLMVCAYAIPFWFWLGLGFGPAILLPLLTAPFAVGITRTVRSSVEFERLFPMTPRTSALALAYGLLLAAGTVAHG
jgi:1,4-dihydroxy-2-naphthoate octaprenyltransferase